MTHRELERELETSRMDDLLGRPAGMNYLLLADAGMGKTSFLLHYFNRNQKRRAGKRLHIVMVSLGRPEALDELTAVQSKQEAVAFLDAFDEDIRAIESAEERLREIMAVCRDFKCVVISCRTQFFPSDEISGPYTIEKIHLAPLSVDEIKVYLQRCIPWHKWKDRHHASSLAASMSDLATLPALLALVPELVAAGRSISEHFELYEYLVESWLERERGWIEPDTLRAISEKLAVAIHLRSSAGGIDRIDADDLVATMSVDASPLEQWQPTARSLLNRDAAGRFTFTHQSTAEYLFISALLHGETSCLGVRWTDSMRRLFVSATNVMLAQQGEPALRRVMARDFVATGLFPLSQPYRDPGHLHTSEILNATAAPRPHSLREGPLWDPTRYVLEHQFEESLYLYDRSGDTILFVPTDWRRVESGAVDPESARLFLVTRGEADGLITTLNGRRIDNRSNWRLPTLEELDLVFLLNLRVAFLPPDQYVWSADHTSDGERLVVRMGSSNNELDHRLNPIGVRKILASNVVTAGYFVSSMPPLGVRDRRGKFDTSFPALLIRVSQGAAELFSTAPQRG